ncbi:MAG TPA: LytTR family DNA-binding domain-containing protein [Gammaproteobacteria bacterium]|nr:LytTR family DNA-binding domain-containing protein [Gammaproteobacteria bacterium]
MRVIIVEDERMVAKSLARCVESVLGESLQQLDVLGDFHSAQARLRETRPDVLLLDLNLHGRNGFELLQHAVAGSFDTIVVSANTDRAIEAFEYGVLDFVPKPFSTERLAQAFERLSGRHTEGASLRYLVVRHAGTLERIWIEDILAIHGANDYSELELLNGARRLHEKTLEKLVRSLSGNFLRIHRSHIVNLAFARSLTAQAGSRYRLTLADGSVLPVGRKWIASVRKAFADDTERGAST